MQLSMAQVETTETARKSEFRTYTPKLGQKQFQALLQKVVTFEH